MGFPMSDLRPHWEEGSGAARLLADGRARIAAARADLAIPDALRLSEWQRTTVSSILAKLVESIEDELRALVAPSQSDSLRASLTSASVPIVAPILARSRNYPSYGLITLALRRAEEHWLQRQAGSDDRFLDELIADADEVVAADAMAVLIARSARLDGFQEPLIGRHDADAELQHQLVWTIAAALRLYMVDRHGIAEVAADAAISEAASSLLATHDEGTSFDALCLRLARRLAAAGRLDDAFLARALDEGGLPLFMAGVAVRTSLPLDAVWELIWDREGAPSLLRAAGIGREAAGAILLRLAHGREDEAVARLQRFDAAEGSLGLWHIDPAYRTAVAALAGSA
jgi:hypothetical protein